jgi:hypothetical protein
LTTVFVGNLTSSPPETTPVEAPQTPSGAVLSDANPNL